MVRYGKNIMAAVAAGLTVMLLMAALEATMAAAKDQPNGKKMITFTHACLITGNMDRLIQFYEKVFQVPAQRFSDDYVEFPVAGAIVSLYSWESHEKLAPGSAQAAANRSVLLEFAVADADAEHVRLKNLGLDIPIVKAPFDTPWGNRTMYFRDPDGNLINFFSRMQKP